MFIDIRLGSFSSSYSKKSANLKIIFQRRMTTGQLASSNKSTVNALQPESAKSFKRPASLVLMCGLAVYFTIVSQMYRREFEDYKRITNAQIEALEIKIQ
jgi:hypothetical protein